MKVGNFCTLIPSDNRKYQITKVYGIQNNIADLKDVEVGRIVIGVNSDNIIIIEQ